MITCPFSSAVWSGFGDGCGDKEGGGGEGMTVGWVGVGSGGGTGEDKESFRGASLPRCLAMEEGGGFDMESGGGADKK